MYNYYLSLYLYDLGTEKVFEKYCLRNGLLQKIGIVSYKDDRSMTYVVNWFQTDPFVTVGGWRSTTARGLP